MQADLPHIVGAISVEGYSFITGEMGLGSYLQVKAMVDSKSWLGRKWYISPHATESEIVLTALKAVLTFAEHEIRESFTYEGLALFHPHPDLDGLLEIATRRQTRD